VKRLVTMTIVTALVAAYPVPTFAYLKFGIQVGSRIVTAKWPQMPIRYFITDQGTTGVTSTQLQQAVQAAFATWDAVSTAQVSSQFVGFTLADPSKGDGATVIGFQNRPDLPGTLGVTSFTYDTLTGAVVESDILFNSSFTWSVSAQGQTGFFDLQSIALHEIGHLHGLAHSALGETELRSGGRRVIAAEAVMFPIAFASGTILGRTLKADDIAGIGDIYPATSYTGETGSISGKVTKSGKGVLGAHVVAFDMRTHTLVGGFSLSDDGSFVIAGLSQGPHVLRVEPLDDGDIESFFDTKLNIDINFRAQFYEKIVVVPQGGGTSGVELKVVAK
jgi:hypothetical protein